MNNQKAFTKPEICFISKKTWKIQAVSQDPAVSDVRWIQKSYFMIKVNTDTGRERSSYIFLLQNSVWIREKQSSLQAQRMLGDREAKGATVASNSWTPACIQDSAQP